MKQIFLRHKNGGGKVYGNDALVTADTFLNRKSSVGDNVEIYTGEIIDSVVCDSAVMHRAHVEDSMISGETRIFGGQVLNSTLSGQCRVWGTPTIQNCDLKNVFVFGEAELNGIVLDAFTRIHAGKWVNPPRHAVIRGEGIEVVLSECTEDRWHVGCFCHPWVTWADKEWRQRIGRAAGWSAELIEEGFAHLQEWRR